MRLIASEIEYIVGHCGASVIFYDPEFARARRKPRARVRRVRTRSSNAPATSKRCWQVRRPSALVDPVSDENATISINYTSGTTGRPKGVMYTHRGAYLNALAEIDTANLRPDSVYLWTLPMFHCNGWCYPWAVTAAGATHVCLPKVEPEAVFESDRTRRRHALLRRADRPDRSCQPSASAAVSAAGSRRHGGCSPGADDDRADRVARRDGDASLRPHRDVRTDHRFGVADEWDALPPEERAKLKARQGVGLITVGPADVRVVEPIDADAPADVVLRDVRADGLTHGEIVMRGNNVMKGYYRDPEATARAFAGGYFHSGDIAVMHPDGYLEIADRAKDVIISGGENISTVQVEKVLLEHPDVLECAVVAKPHEHWGEVPKAFVVVKAGREVSAEALIAHCRERLPALQGAEGDRVRGVAQDLDGENSKIRFAGERMDRIRKTRALAALAAAVLLPLAAQAATFAPDAEPRAGEECRTGNADARARARFGRRGQAARARMDRPFSVRRHRSLPIDLRLQRDARQRGRRADQEHLPKGAPHSIQLAEPHSDPDQTYYIYAVTWNEGTLSFSFGLTPGGKIGTAYFRQT